MKLQVSSIDLHFLIKELDFLVGARLDKVYHPNKEELLLQLHVPSTGKKLLRIISGKVLFLSENKGSIDSPGGFCMFLRKYLGNGRIREIIQIESERIVKIGFENKLKYNMYIELFGKGNIILTDENEIILSALHLQKWADREIKKGVQYNYPKKETCLFNISREDFFKFLDFDKDIVFSLAKKLGIGGFYAEKILERAGINKTQKKIKTEERDLIYLEFQKLMNSKIESTLTKKEIFPIDVGVIGEKFNSFSEAIDKYFQDNYSAEEFVSKHQAIIDKTKKIVDQQREQITSLEEKSIEANKKGELIYENYKLISDILSEINKARDKYSFEEIKEKLKGHKIVKDIDSKEKKIVIEI